MARLDPVTDTETAYASLPAFADARRTMQLLTRAAIVQGLFLLCLLLPAVWAHHHHGRLPTVDAFLRAGTIGALCGALAISLTATFVCLLLAWGRDRTFRDSGLDTRLQRAPATVVAGWPQAVFILAGTVAAVALLRAWPPMPALPAGASAPWPVSAALMLVPAFLLMVLEQTVAGTSPGSLPEVTRLVALVRLPPLVIFAHIAIITAGGFGLPVFPWAADIVAFFLVLVAVELALRTLAVWFLPLPVPEAAQAAIGSALAALLQPGALRPGEMARRMRSQFGIDITRSWAVAYARSAAIPVALVLAAFTWGLSGVTRIDLNQRGSYERFGAPVAMLRPGLHVILPWPFGRIRMVEYGVVHALPVGATLGGKPLPADLSTADGPAPADANQLWDQQRSNDTSYIIASQSADRQSFETVSVHMTVLYRVGLDDVSARRALYGAVDPGVLVRSLAGRELSYFFASRTLLDVLDERNQEIATTLRAALQADLDREQSGLQVVALVVESMHPPSGAATAYRGVQTEQILASMRYSEELGQAQSTLSVATAQAHDLRDQAQAAAEELISSALVERSQSDADTIAYRNSGRAFLIERYFDNLRGALSRGALEIVDSRLGAPNSPLLDLRPAPAPAPTPSAMTSYGTQSNSQ